MYGRRILLVAATIALGGCAAQRELAFLAVPGPTEFQIGLDEVVNLRLTVQNTGAAPLTVRDVDIARSLLAGVDLLEVEPVPTQPPLELRDYVVERIEQEIAPGGSLVVRLRLRGREPGRHSGEIDFSLANFASRSVPITATVGEPTPTPALPSD